VAGYPNLDSAANARGLTKKVSKIVKRLTRGGTLKMLKRNKAGLSERTPNAMPLHLHLIRRKSLKALSPRATMPFQIISFRS
jgi:hypothetical protein